jgi:hypothetical protein
MGRELLIPGTGIFPAYRFLAFAMLALLPAPAQAARVGTIKIHVDGKLWLSGGTFDDGSPPPAAVWRCLTSGELRLVEGAAIAADPADPLRATLRGRIVIDVRYGGKG